MTLRKKPGTSLTTTGSKSGRTGTSLRTVANSSSIAKPDNRASNALAKAAAYSGGRTGRIVFALDATASRSAIWEEAKSIQRKMFTKIASVGKMTMRLMHYGGDTLSDHGWSTDTHDIARKMDAVSCIGGQTKLVQILNKCASDQPGEQAQSILFVGDHFEEEFGEAMMAASELQKRKIKVFCCQDGNEPTAASVFEKICEMTGGRFFKLGEDMPLDEICENIAILTIGGESALKKLGSGKSAKLLLSGPGDSNDNTPDTPAND